MGEPIVEICKRTVKYGGTERITDLAFDRLFLDGALHILFRYSDGLSKVLESALANLGGINGSTMCLFTRWDAWLALISSASTGALAGDGTSGCC